MTILTWFWDGKEIGYKNLLSYNFIKKNRLSNLDAFERIWVATNVPCKNVELYWVSSDLSEANETAVKPVHSNIPAVGLRNSNDGI